MLNFRAKRNFSLLSHLLIGDILDIGSGNCRIAKLISEDHMITCLDVIDGNKTDLPLRLYDGKKLPFKNKAFDTSLLIYVLHHADYPEEILREATRVTKKRIIIFEDVYKNIFQLYLLKLLDLGNLISNRRIPTPFNFKKEEEWYKIICRYGKVQTKKIPMILPRKQVCYILDITSG